jgi:hypothetical protein
MTGALHSRSSVEHYTPALIVEAARAALGGSIFLDPASNPFANRLVKASVIFEKGGLDCRWSGPLFLNPPGKCEGNPSGAGPWWKKLVDEWSRDGDWSAIFVGYSLEQLQTFQSWSPWHPLDMSLICIPKRRIEFDVEAAEMRARLNVARRSATAPEAIAALDRLRAKVDEAIKEGEERIAGASPTHGNYVVMLCHDIERERPRFRQAFAEIGWCS